MQGPVVERSLRPGGSRDKRNKNQFIECWEHMSQYLRPSDTPSLTQERFVVNLGSRVPGLFALEISGRVP